MASRSKKSKNKFKRAPVVAGLIAIVLIGATLFIFQKPIISEIGINKKEEDTRPVSLTFVGDIMFDRGVRRSIERNFGGDYNALFKDASYLKKSDITFGNLEGPVAIGGRRVGSVYSFRMDPKGLVAMKDAGFDILSFANNHVGDYSSVAFVETLDNIKSQSMLYTGAGKNKAEALTPQVFLVRGITIGFLAASDVGPEWMKAGDNTPGQILARDKDLKAAIAKADKEVDILVVSYHFGNEYSPANETQKKIAHEAIDLGADVIVGHHPHVMERIEIYKDRPIFYSLGNFIFDQYFSEHTMRGMVVKVFIDIKTKEIKHEAYVMKMSRQFIPGPLTQFEDSLLLKKTFYP